MNQFSTRNSQRGSSRTVIIILISIGLIIVLGLLAFYLLAPHSDRARMMAAESFAMSTVHNLVVNQINYYSSFGDTGYARDLASLGPGPSGKCDAGAIPAHACIIDAILGGSACTGSNWCTQAGYKFNIQGICANGKCADFVISATPVDALNGSRNFCSTSDAAIHTETAAPKSAPFTLAACQALPAL
jgi:hypothetical protein